MSEYQYVAFQAVDKPLGDRELAFAEKQSTRAEITRWSFENEHHYGNFHGNVNGILRHGYDAHLHYANYGTRKIAIRLPAGFPFSKSVWSEYTGDEGLAWSKDAKGKASAWPLTKCETKPGYGAKGRCSEERQQSDQPRLCLTYTNCGKPETTDIAGRAMPVI